MSFFKAHIILLLSLAAYIANASSDLRQTRHTPHLEEDESRESLLSRKPFRAAITDYWPESDKHIYAEIMSQRPEFASIQWKSASVMQLAEHFWNLQLSIADYMYHRKLNQTCRLLMEYNGVPGPKIKEVIGLVTDWSKSRRKFPVNNVQRTAEEIMARNTQKRLKNNLATLKRRQAHRLGLSLPLLQYMTNIDTTSMTPKQLYMEALKYRDRYPSGHVFLLNLKKMWKTLDIDDGQVYQCNHDRRTTNYPKWPQKKSKRSKGGAEQSIEHQSSADAQPDCIVLENDSYDMSSLQEQQHNSMTPMPSYTIDAPPNSDFDPYSSMSLYHSNGRIGPTNYYNHNYDRISDIGNYNLYDQQALQDGATGLYRFWHEESRDI